MSFGRFHNTNLPQLLARDLAGWPVQHSDNGLLLQLTTKQSVMITIRKQPLFMAAIHHSQFKLQNTTQLSASLVICVHQPGWIRKYPVSFYIKRGKNTHAASLVNFLNSFSLLRQTITELDYHRFCLRLENGKWYCEIEPWAASEVICHLPPFRRYLRLVAKQRMLLLSILSMINEAMTAFDSRLIK